MTSVTEWLIAGMAAAAQADNTPPAEIECVSVLVANLKLALDTHGTVILDRNLCRRQCRLLPLNCIDEFEAGAPRLF
jgi:hypothetical protein